MKYIIDRIYDRESMPNVKATYFNENNNEFMSRFLCIYNWT